MTEEPPAIVRKRDGAFTYTTSDLATVKYRIDHYAPDAMLYVVRDLKIVRIDYYNSKQQALEAAGVAG